MYKCAYVYLVLLQSKQNEGSHMVRSPVVFTSSPAKMKGGIQLSQLGHQKAGHCIESLSRQGKAPPESDPSHLFWTGFRMGWVIAWKCLSPCITSKRLSSSTIEKVGLTSDQILPSPEQYSAYWCQKELNWLSTSPRVLWISWLIPCVPIPPPSS